MTAYDCSGITTPISTISLNEIKPCAASKTNTIISTKKIQVLQPSTQSSIPIRRCKVMRERNLYRCTWTSNMEPVSSGSFKEVIPVSNKECTSMHNSGTYTTSYGSIVDGLKNNEMNVFSSNDIGTVKDGSCSGVSYTHKGRTYDKVFSYDRYEIEISMEENIFDTNEYINLNKYGYKYKDQQAIKPDGSYLYWEYNPLERCTGRELSLLYEGLAEKFEYSTGRIIWMVNDTTTAFAMELSGYDDYCGKQVQKLTSSGIFIYEMNDNQDKLSKNPPPISAQLIDLHADLLAKVIFVERHFAKELKTLSIYLELTFCELRKSFYMTLQGLSNTHPELYITTLFQREGLMMDVRGSLAYIFECTKVFATFRNTTNCYQMIPINYQNSSVFAHPVTKVILKYSEEYPCNPITPTGYYVDKNWIETSPFIQLLRGKPEILDPNNNNSWTYGEIGSLRRKSLYSEGDLESYRLYTMKKMSSNGLLQNMGKSLAGVEITPEFTGLQNLLTENNVQSITSQLITKSISSIWRLSNWASTAFGLYLITKMIYWVLQLVTNVYVLYRKYGLNKRLFGAISDHATQLLTAEGEHKVKLNINLLRRFRKSGNAGGELVAENININNFENTKDNMPSNNEKYTSEKIIPNVPIYPRL